MTRIENLKSTRARRKATIPERTLFLNVDELKLILENRRSKQGINLHSEKNLPLKPEILAHTNHLKNDANWSERVYAILNDIKEAPKCHCGNDVSFAQNNVGYHAFCSRKCSAESEETKARRAQTNIEKYGDAVAFRNESVKQKQKETCLSRYGFANSWGHAKHSNYSKISQELFWNVWHNSKQNGSQYFAELTGELRLKLLGRVIKPDYAQVNENDLRIIEFDGDYWHSDSKDYDNTRDEILKDAGWQILRIKESEYLNDKLETINKCIAFINGELD